VKKNYSSKKVAIFGAFDIIHPGHIHLFKQAAALGEVIVVVARDSTIAKVKGQTPFYPEANRVATLKKIDWLTEVRLGQSVNPYEILKIIKPEIILLGHDQKIFIDQLPEELKKINLQPKILRAQPLAENFFKSSKIRPALENNQAGFLLINKPAGLTSHDIVNQVRKILNTKKVGHAGTLDPLAQGLLIIGVKEAVKMLSWWHYFTKTYQAQLVFGKTSDTYDTAGQIKNITTKKISQTKLEQALQNFIGQQTQRPPIFSAKKIKGQKAYTLARKNIAVEIPEQTVKIYQSRLIDFSWPNAAWEITCSSGTYIRSLIHDLGQNLSTGAIMTDLIRLKIGPASIKSSIKIESLNSHYPTQGYFLSPLFLLKKINDLFIENTQLNS